MEPNPVGQSDKRLLINNIEEVIQLWGENNPEPTWWSNVKGQWVKAIHYIVVVGDYFIRIIDKMMDSGPDKKATVLDALSDVYDAIIPALLPIILKPFNARIKSFVIDVVASIAIDFVVGKYRGSNWSPEATTFKFNFK